MAQADRSVPQGLTFPALSGQDMLFRALRGALFVGVWLLVWIGLEPFSSLANNDLLALSTGNDFWTYVLFGLAGGLVVAATITRRTHFWAVLVDPLFALLAAYICVNIFLSVDFSASLRRFVLFGVVFVIASLICLLPRDRDEFARLIVGASLVVVGLSYVGVLLMPELSVHQATDLVEARLAGDWRGVFGHKNLAGGVFSAMVFIGIFAVRAGLPVAGLSLAILSGIFVVMSGAKSSIILIVLTLMASGASARVTSAFWRAVIVFLPLAGLTTLGIGSVISPAVGSIVASLPFDASFTGRSDIWAFALEKFAERPWVGHGFQSFWSLESTKFGIEDSEQWAGSAANGHNSFLDTALNLGFVGLALTVLVVVVRPFRDDLRARRNGADPATTTLWFQLWLFCLHLACMESFFFSRTDPMWFTLLVAIVGLRMVARFPVTDGPVKNSPESAAQ